MCLRRTVRQVKFTDCCEIDLWKSLSVCENVCVEIGANVSPFVFPSSTEFIWSQACLIRLDYCVLCLSRTSVHVCFSVCAAFGFFLFFPIFSSCVRFFVSGNYFPVIFVLDFANQTNSPSIEYTRTRLVTCFHPFLNLFHQCSHCSLTFDLFLFVLHSSRLFFFRYVWTELDFSKGFVHSILSALAISSLIWVIGWLSLVFQFDATCPSTDFFLHFHMFLIISKIFFCPLRMTKKKQATLCDYCSLEFDCINLTTTVEQHWLHRRSSICSKR